MQRGEKARRLRKGKEVMIRGGGVGGWGRGEGVNHRGNQTSTFRTFNFLFTEWLIQWPTSSWDDEMLPCRFHSLRPPSWKGLDLNTVKLVQTLLLLRLLFCYAPAVPPPVAAAFISPHDRHDMLESNLLHGLHPESLSLLTPAQLHIGASERSAMRMRQVDIWAHLDKVVSR